jgi:MoaA/NifB/PqqE/SkfB family radical SAM enzyme
MNMNYVCFNITSECNMRCPYCYRVGNTKGKVSLENAVGYIDHLVRYGCKTINITGGEPLLNNEWKEIIKYCADKGLFIILSTNGMQLDLHDEGLDQIDVLSLPLDGGSPEVNRKTRSERHFFKIKNLIDEYVRSNYKFKLKINTVLSGYNYDKLDELLRLLDNSKIVWKIFELRKKGEYYEFPEDKVIAIEETIQSLLSIVNSQHKCSIYCMGKQMSELHGYNVKPNYIVLDYNGDIYLADEEENKLLFNLNSATAEQRNYGPEDLLNNQYCEELKNANK